MKILGTILLRIYQIIIMLPSMLVATFITATVVALGSICFGGKYWGYYPAKWWSKFMMWISLCRVTVRREGNLDKTTSYIFVCNHQGAYDIFAIYGWLGHNFKWMMKQALRSIPMVGYACYRAGHIYVDKSSPSAIRHTMEMAEKQLRGGMSVVVFPEGTRSKTGRLGNFKRGAYILAQEFNLPVVPVTIDGSYSIMPITAKLPRPGHIILTIHKPIEASENGHDITDLIDKSRKAIICALPERNC